MVGGGLWCVDGGCEWWLWFVEGGWWLWMAVCGGWCAEGDVRMAVAGGGWGVKLDGL